MDPNIQQAPIQNAPPPPIVPANPPSRDWLKWVLLIVAAVILSSATTYFALQSQSTKQTQSKITPTPSPTEASAKAGDLYREPTGSAVSPVPNGTGATANWKTFSGKTFLFKYPPSWADDTGSINPENIELISLRISPSAVFEATYKNSSYSKGLESFAGRKSQTMTVGGREAMQFETIGSMGVLPPGYAIVTVMIKGSDETSYLITFNGDRRDIAGSLVNQILSTFQFID